MISPIHVLLFGLNNSRISEVDPSKKSLNRIKQNLFCSHTSIYILFIYALCILTKIIPFHWVLHESSFKKKLIFVCNLVKIFRREMVCIKTFSINLNAPIAEILDQAARTLLCLCNVIFRYQILRNNALLRLSTNGKYSWLCCKLLRKAKDLSRHMYM